MLLESSILILNIFAKNIFLLLITLFFLLIFNFYKNKDFIYKLQKMDKFILIYLFYLVISIFFYKTGKIIFNIGSFYITYEGLLKSITTFIKLLNFLLISITISYSFKNKSFQLKSKNLKIIRFEKYYSEIIEHIFESIPFIFDLIKKKVKISNSYKKILLKVYRNL